MPCFRSFYEALAMISTHILNISTGIPASGIRVTLGRLSQNGDIITLGEAYSGPDGRICTFSPCQERSDLSAIAASAANVKNTDSVTDATEGLYQLRFYTRPYFDMDNISTFYSHIDIHFYVHRGQSYHVPLLLSPFGYSTYRGS